MEIQSRENPKFGRKVFFVNPPLSFEHIVIDELRNDEYEVYVINDYKRTKAVLREHPDSMLFINIDVQLSFKQWFNFICSFREDEVLKTVFIGVISGKATANDAQLFLMNLTLGGGFIMINNKKEMLFDKIKGILEINGAKGNRKYLRLDCRNLDDVSGYFVSGNKLYDITVDNISSVGLACTFKSELTGLLTPNKVLDNISLTIGRKTVICPAVVFRVMNNVAVMLFTKQISSESRQDIKKFVHSTLISEFNGVVSNVMQDMTVYKNEVDLQAVAALKKTDVEFDGDSLFGQLEEL